MKPSDIAAAQCFFNDKPYKRGNTEVIVGEFETSLWCQNNIIAWKSINDSRICLAAPNPVSKAIVRKLNAVVQTETKAINVVSHQRQAYFRAKHPRVKEKCSLFRLDGETIGSAVNHYNEMIYDWYEA